MIPKIIQAPMAGASGVDMAVAVSKAGGLGSLPMAALGRDDMERCRTLVGRDFNANFFCFASEEKDTTRWRQRLDAYHVEHGVTPASGGTSRRPFDDEQCSLVEEFEPRFVSFHFGLPPDELLRRVKRSSVVLASATTVAEALWLESKGADVVIAQGSEAGGHRSMFLATDVNAQVGTFALVPQVRDAVSVPVVAAGGIADGRGVKAALALGADAAQIGTAYLKTQEALITEVHRHALENATEASSVLTNVFSGRPARGIKNRLVNDFGPMCDDVPPFPTATLDLKALKAKSPADFGSLWTGQAYRLAPNGLSAFDLTKTLLQSC